MGSEFTIAIPTHNSSRTVTGVIECLLMQNIEPMNILIADNASIDGTFEMLVAQIRHGYYRNKSAINANMSLRQVGNVAGGKKENIPFMRRMLAQLVTTPYIFFLDSDVLLAPNTLPVVFEEFKKRENTLGMLGVRYDPKADHIKMGATFMKTDTARRISWIIDDRCECINARKQLDTLNLGTDHHDTLQARHYPKLI